tara:strand:- start:675 stop:1145 length:471 start_codon:yes stop_codon:yes gene_type:complete
MALPQLVQDASVAEILSEASKLKSKKDKVEFLSQYKNRKDMEHIVKGAYHPAIVWLVPDGPLPEGVQLSDVPAVDLADDRLIRAHRQFQYLVKGGPDMKQSKREDIYLNILRAVHESEAKLLMSVVGKKLPYKGMTRALMLETFPDWLPKSNELSE